MKKLVSTLLAASLGFCSVNASASLPGGGSSFNFMGPNLNLQLAADVISSVKIPLDNLQTILKEKYAYVTGTELWVFSELSEIGTEFVILRHNFLELESILTSYIGIDRDFQKRIKEIKSEIKELKEKLKSIPAHKPTAEDIEQGRCYGFQLIY